MVLDFDGTLAPIVADRDAASLAPATRAALRLVAKCYPVAILSGRSAADVRARLDGALVTWVVGNHGAGWPRSGRSYRSLVGSWRKTLKRRMGAVKEVEIEDKGNSLALHFRGARRPGQAASTIARAIAGLPGASVIPGKRVVNLVPAAAGDKGTALGRMAEAAGAARVLFVGDDITDESAFRATLPVPLVTVRVGHWARTAARYHVSRRADVDLLLRDLARLRKPAKRAPRRGAEGQAGRTRGD